MSATITRAEMLAALQRIPTARLAHVVSRALELGHCDICDARVPSELHICAACEREMHEADAADIANDAAKLREDWR